VRTQPVNRVIPLTLTLEAASAVHVAARGSLAFATEATVKGPCHDSNCTLGDNCTMTVDLVKTDDLGLTN